MTHPGLTGKTTEQNGDNYDLVFFFLKSICLINTNVTGYKLSLLRQVFMSTGLGLQAKCCKKISHGSLNTQSQVMGSLSLMSMF